ncbi:MAG: sigma-70 family RNA polymerase sigma factor [Marinifilaceae bacterium]|jgi:RNA polymerase sigma-70 factor (ECF subfamily)|nr:sigma-70 family RNA polymerase sigma factor [Marinifilaceae bacterium]
MNKENEILNNLKTNSISAYEEFYRYFFTDLVLYANSILKSKDSSEDLVQEVFVDFWINKKYRKIKSKLRSYIYASIRNACFRSLKNNKISSYEQIESILDKQFENNTEEEKIKQNEKLYKALSLLPSSCKQIFIMCIVYGYKYQETADELGISINTVRTQMSRGFKILRENLKQDNLLLSLMLNNLGLRI